MFSRITSIFNNLKLGPKFTILLGMIFCGGIIASGIALSILFNYNAQNDIESRAEALMETMSSLRSYTNNQVAPELRQELERQFLPQGIPAYSVREVFESLRHNKEYKDYFYKDATLNPSNLRDLADNFEKEIIQKFRDKTNLQELRGFHYSYSNNMFYIARPLIVDEQSCLECHGAPSAAPKTMVERYGTKNGYYWKLDEIVGAQIIYVPASQVFQIARQSSFLALSIVLGIFAVTILLVNQGLNKYIVKPLKQMTQIAKEISVGNMVEEFDLQYNDEVGKLAEAFNRMKTSLNLAMKRLEKYRR